MLQTIEIKQEIKRLNNQFLQSSDFVVKEIEWNQDEKVIICYYSSLVNKNEVERNLFSLKQINKTSSQSKENKGQGNSNEQNTQSGSNEKSNVFFLKQVSKTSFQFKENKGQGNSNEQNTQSGSNEKSNESASENQDKLTQSDAETNEQENSNEQKTKQSDSNEKSNESVSENQNQLAQSDAATKGQENANEQKTEISDSNEKSKESTSENQLNQDKIALSDSVTITTEKYDDKKLIDYVCNGETIIILLQTKKMIRLNSPEFGHGTPDEPQNESILRGSHEGFVENFDLNVSLIRKRIKNNKLVVKKVLIGKETKTEAYYSYLDNVVDKEALKTVEERLQGLKLDMYLNIGQLNDALDDNVWSPFSQLLSTERPDRVAANIMEGKIAIMTDISPTALIGPVTFFSFYQTPDDYSARVLTGTFYRFMRMLSFLVAIFLPAFYIAIVSFHFEVLPIELANKVKTDINQIPYRPLIEAMIMEITIELIREASVRLPKSIGQTIGIVGGLVIGQSIVSAGLVSNLMVIVVAFTAISSFVVPSIEQNTTIRILRFPFMFLASIFGFFGIVIGTFLLVVHLLNLSSLKKPYLSPIIPFEPKELYKIFFREPNYKAKKQTTSFSPKKDENV